MPVNDLVFGNVKRSFPPGWYKLDTQTYPAAVDGTVTLQANKVRTTIFSDAREQGMRPYVHAFGVRCVTPDTAAVAGVGGAALLWNTAKQRMNTVGLKINQPNMKGKYRADSISLAAWEDVGIRMNYPAHCLGKMFRNRKHFKAGTDLVQDFVGVRRPVQVYSIADDVALNDSRLDFSSIPNWRNDDRLVLSRWNAFEGVGVETIDDFCVIPVASYSGCGLFTHDRLPLALMIDSNLGWEFTIKNRKAMTSSANASSLFVVGSDDTEYETVELWAYLTFPDDRADFAFGVLYTSENKPIATDMNFEPHLYHEGSVWPDYSSTTADAVAGFVPGIAYDEWYTFINTALILLTINEHTVFPLKTLREYINGYNGFNAYAKWTGMCPELGMSDINTTTLMGSRNGGAKLTDVPAQAVNVHNQILGNTTEFPWFPIFWNIFAAQGFGLQFMAPPRSSFRLKADFTQASLSDAQKARFNVIYASDFWDDDSLTIAAAENYDIAAYDRKRMLPTYIPATDKLTSKSGIVEALLPSVCRR